MVLVQGEVIKSKIDPRQNENRKEKTNKWQEEKKVIEGREEGKWKEYKVHALVFSMKKD